MMEATNDSALSWSHGAVPYACEEFRLRIRSTGNDQGRYEVFASCGEAESPAVRFDLPFAPDELDHYRVDLVELLQAWANRSPPPLAGTEFDEIQMQARALGAMLFQILFTGEVARLYDSHRPKATGGKSLRIRLCIEPPELDALPWELLFDEMQKDYLCLDQCTPVVRSRLTGVDLRPLLVKPPLRILGMVALPYDAPPLDVVQEQHWLAKAVQPLVDKHQVYLEWVQGQNWRDVDEMLRREQWHIFHYIGHANYNETTQASELQWADAKGEMRAQATQQVVRIFRNQPDLRLVVLNACQSAGMAAALTSETGLPAALAMQYAISDDSAIELTRNFYTGLVEGEPLDVAVWQARHAITQEFPNSLEWGAPVLYMRPRDGHLFDIATKGKLPQPIESKEIQAGLYSLAQLMKTRPDVHKAVEEFRVVIEIALEQIELLSDYKDLHDILHDLEFTCYQPILINAEGFPEDDRALDNLQNSVFELQEIVDRLKTVAGRKSLPEVDIRWVADVEEANAMLRQAVSQADQAALEDAIWLLQRTLNTNPSHLNDRLVAAAEALRLGELAKAMATIYATLSKWQNLAIDQMARFKIGADLLPSLHESLTILKEEHNEWQAIDRELRRIDAEIARSLRDLVRSWPRLKEDMVRLCGDEKAQWTTQLLTTGQQLDCAIKRQNEREIKNSFRAYRRHGIRHFNQVDKTLKRQCDELRKIGDPLSAILEMLL